MIFDPGTLAPRDMYRFMIDSIVPRPIAFVSTVDTEGGFNVAPFSFFNAITGRPPLVSICVSERRTGIKDTLRNVQDSGEFVVNVVPEALFEQMVQSSGEWPPEVDEIELTGLTAAPSERVRAPRVAESPVHLECRLARFLTFGRTTMIVGEIVYADADERVITDGRVDAEKLRPVGRLGGDGYAVVREVLHRARPRVATPPPEKGA